MSKQMRKEVQLELDLYVSVDEKKPSLTEDCEEEAKRFSEYDRINDPVNIQDAK